MSGIRYDRQIRLWGEEGQNSIEKASVCVLGSSSLAAEILKSLVLPGIGFFCIIDDAIVVETDLGQNFFLTKDDLGKSRAAVLTEHLMELNQSVKGTFFLENCQNLSPKLHENLLNFSIVITTCLTDNATLKLADYLYSYNIYLIYTRVCGMFGYLRLCFRQHVIWNMHTENSPHDFRLDAPFEEVIKMANLENLDSMNYERHSHTPYLLLYIKALEKWRQTLSNSGSEILDNLKQTEIPNTYQKRKEFERVLWSMRKANEKGSLLEENFEEAKRNVLKSFSVQKIPAKVETVFNDVKTNFVENLNNVTLSAEKHDFLLYSDLLRPFWIFSSAVRRFSELHGGRLPLSGQLPDMVSDSERYVQIQKIYRNKAEEHAKEVFNIANEIYIWRRYFLSNFLRDIKVTDSIKKGQIDVNIEVNEKSKIESSLSWVQCQEFCKNVAKIALQNGVSLSDEIALGLEGIFQQILHSSITLETNKEEENDKPKAFAVDPLVWFILMKAMDRFYYEKNRFPGTNGVPCTIDSKDLKRRVYDLVCETKNDELIQSIEKLIPQNAINEICRYGAAEPHVITAILGGVVAQEAIKLVTHQYLPLDNALIYDGHLQCATSFRV